MVDIPVTAPTSYRFRVHLLISVRRGPILNKGETVEYADPIKQEYEVTAFDPDKAGASAKAHFGSKYPGARIVIGKIKRLREDQFPGLYKRRRN